MKAGEVKRGYQVKEHGNWNLVDMVLVTFVNAYPETDSTKTFRFILSCGCTLMLDSDDELEAREWNPRSKLVAVS